jgi:di/tricarboxylate transporter
MLEAIPIYVTGSPSSCCLSILNMVDLGQTSANYADSVEFLFLDGFILAKADEKSNLHGNFALDMLALRSLLAAQDYCTSPAA